MSSGMYARALAIKIRLDLEATLTRRGRSCRQTGKAPFVLRNGGARVRPRLRNTPQQLADGGRQAIMLAQLFTRQQGGGTLLVPIFPTAATPGLIRNPTQL